MSELIQTIETRPNIRRNLLIHASTLVLCGVLGVPANAGDGKPTVWIEIGGQLERLDTPQQLLSPHFFDDAVPAVSGAMIDAQRPARYNAGYEGKVTFEPAGNWVFSVSARYGQVKNQRHLHYETPGIAPFEEHVNHVVNGVNGPSFFYPASRQFGDGQADFSSSHLVLDFQAGKDVGLGLFGRTATSTISAGVRFAQFTSRADVRLHARPVLGYSDPVPFTGITYHFGKYHGTYRLPFHQSNSALFQSTRHTQALGPSLSWTGAVPVAGHADATTVEVDWGVNAAVLFGRQLNRNHHRTTGYSLNHNVKVPVTTSYATSNASDRSRSVTIPNIGGFAGLSLKFPNAKISLGYRGDFFFNATDSGIDARNTANQNFYGPYATISIGLP
jgi:hypothetical protein